MRTQYHDIGVLILVLIESVHSLFRDCSPVTTRCTCLSNEIRILYKYDGITKYGCTDCTSVTCGIGQYFICVDPGPASCSGCRGGTYIEGSGASPYCSPCAAGKYRDTGMTPINVCFNCPAGTYSNQKASIKCSDCVVGTFSSYGASACQPCSTSACPAGKRFESLCPAKSTYDASCVPCSPGYFQSGGNSDCSVCPTGTFTNKTGTAACLSCTFLNGWTSASPLLPFYLPWAAQPGTLGSISDIGMGLPTSDNCPYACPSNFYPDISIRGCVGCPKGTHGSGIGDCEPCIPLQNTYWLNPVFGSDGISYETCLWDCSTGFERWANSSVCTPCGINMYQTPTAVDKNSVPNKCKSCSSCAFGYFKSSQCSSTSDAVCTVCRTRCPAGYYISGPCTANADLVCTRCKTNCSIGYFRYPTEASCTGSSNYDASGCVQCTQESACIAGKTYLEKTCDGFDTVDAECVACTTISCPTETYKAACTRSRNSICVNYTVCQKGYFLNGYTKFSDGACSKCTNCTLKRLYPGVACNSLQDSQCYGAPCDLNTPCYQNNSRQYCDFTYYEPNASVAFTGKGVCGICPEGYSSDGLRCYECPPDSTCDRFGQVACKGECGPGIVPTCNDVSEFAECKTLCDSAVNSSQLVTRSSTMRGFVCAPYFSCKPGYYFSFYASGVPGCPKCTTSPNLYEIAISSGVSAGDAGSCIFDCDPRLAYWSLTGCVSRSRLSNNKVNFYGLDSRFQCPIGTTSQENAALTLADCIQCPPLPDYSQRLYSGTCGWGCVSGTKRATSCVQTYACTSSGFSGDTQCGPTALPWQPPGYAKTGAVITWGPSIAYQVVDGVLKHYVLVQKDRLVIFETRKYGTYNRHNIIVAGFGGQVSTIKNKGQVCSAATSIISGYDFVFMVYCNTSFISYLNLNFPTVAPKILIGSGVPGFVHGFKTQALFGIDLSIAIGNDPRTLVVCDRWNGALRQVRIWGMPGGYLTESTSIAVFNSWTLGPVYPVINGTYFLFVIEGTGIYQLHAATWGITVLYTEADLPLTGILDFRTETPYNLSVVYQNTTAIITPTYELCPDMYVSFAGGDCNIRCGLGQYVSNNGVCVSCGSPICGPGQILIPCNSTAPAMCKDCPALDSGKRYTTPLTCDIFVYLPPCPRNYYNSSGICLNCPVLSGTTTAGAESIYECKCFTGVKYVNGSCKAGQLYDLPQRSRCGFGKYNRGDAQSCTSCFTDPCPVCGIGYYSGYVCTCGQCVIPRNATATSSGVFFGIETSCLFQCNPGFYRNTTAALVGSCQPCDNVPDIGTFVSSNGYDNSPSSCEWCYIIQCPRGMYSDNACICQPCALPKNTVAISNGSIRNSPTSCQWACAVGFYYNTTMSMCMNCVSSPVNGHMVNFTTNGVQNAPGSCV